MRESVEQRLERWAQQLRATGGRLTSERLAILRVLAQDPSHPSAEDIYRQVKADFPALSLATVYKTLAVWEAMGEALAVATVKETSRYDGLNPYPHPHLVCTECGSVVDLQASEVAALLQAVSKCAGQWRLSARAEFWGLCPRCQA